jgi:hypothetical protein
MEAVMRVMSYQIAYKRDQSWFKSFYFAVFIPASVDKFPDSAAAFFERFAQ